MIIYLETREVVLEHVRRNRIEEEVGERLKAIAGRRVSPAEIGAWRNSFQYVSQFLLDPKIPAALGVAIEYQIHNIARRIDLLLSGRSPDDRHAAVIVELKQWETVDATATGWRGALCGGRRPAGAHPPRVSGLELQLPAGGLQHRRAGARHRDQPALPVPLRRLQWLPVLAG